MGKISVLPKEVVSKIAAGEVIERPANVIKELVENSIDANASAIRIEIEDSGLKKIAVFDNGNGMSRDDLELCVLPHTTSKITSADDLFTLDTMGFRGEALNSIASVSNFTVFSKTSDQEYGYRLDVSDAKILNINPEPMNTGTAVIVQDLFYNLPARKQFIKNKQYEYTQIIDMATVLALSNPTIGFSLYNNSKEVFTLPKNQTFEERLEFLLGANSLTNYVKVASSPNTDTKINVDGYISKPQYAFKTNKKQILFINRRYVSPSLISTEMRDFYGNLIEYRMHPAFVLAIQVDPQTIDINVHPRKESVRFLNSEAVFATLRQQINSALQKHDLTFIKQGFDSLDALLAKEATARYHAQSDLFSSTESRKFLQVHNMYLVVETDKGITLIDQHAAHERILYEKFLARFSSSITGEFDKLPTDEIISLSVSESELLLNNFGFFESLGFKIEEFGKNKFRITHAPAVLQNRNYQVIFADFLADINTEFSSGLIDIADEKTKKALSYLACRSAIKTGESLTKDEAAHLLSVLDMTNSKYTCPHGRPTRVDLPLSEVNRFFKI